MSAKSMQMLIAVVGSAIFIVVVLRLGRRQVLSFRYTVGWLMLGLVGVLAGVLVPVTIPLAAKINLSPPAILGVGAIVLLVGLCVQLSISISGLQEQIRKLTEEVAFLRQETESDRLR